MKPNAPPPQLVMSPVFWPRARILKKHWATSRISSAIASALLSTIGPAPSFGPPRSCVVPMPSPLFPLSVPISPVDTAVVNFQNDTLVVVLGRLGSVACSTAGVDMEMDPAGQQVTDTGTAGVIARPPLLFLAALLIGLISDHVLPLSFRVPRIDLGHRI